MRLAVWLAFATYIAPGAHADDDFLRRLDAAYRLSAAIRFDCELRTYQLDPGTDIDDDASIEAPVRSPGERDGVLYRLVTLSAAGDILTNANNPRNRGDGKPIDGWIYTKDGSFNLRGGPPGASRIWGPGGDVRGFAFGSVPLAVVSAIRLLGADGRTEVLPEVDGRVTVRFGEPSQEVDFDIETLALLERRMTRPPMRELYNQHVRVDGMEAPVPMRVRRVTALSEAAGGGVSLVVEQMTAPPEAIEEPPRSFFEWWTYAPKATDFRTKEVLDPGNVVIGVEEPRPPQPTGWTGYTVTPEMQDRARTDPSYRITPTRPSRWRQGVLAGGIAAVLIGVVLMVRRKLAA